MTKSQANRIDRTFVVLLRAISTLTERQQLLERSVSKRKTARR